MNRIMFLEYAIPLTLATSPGLARAPNSLVVIAVDVTYSELPLYGG